MYFVQFTPPRVREYSDFREFEAKTRRFINSRETENNYIHSLMPGLLKKTVNAIMFTVEEESTVIAAGLYLTRYGGLVMTWAPNDAIDTVIEHAIRSRWTVTQVFAPAHCSYFAGKAYAQKTNQGYQLGRTERVYQLVRPAYLLPKDGHIQVAVEEDLPLVTRWMKGFVSETNYESDGRTAEQMTNEMLTARVLYLWKAPRAVSMAAWVCPTTSGATINYVYTPPELRGRGYAKAVTAALAEQMLASGVRYVSILTDTQDAQTNAMYQSIGAQSICEFTRCTIQPAVPEKPAPSKGLSTPLALL